MYYHQPISRSSSTPRTDHRDRARSRSTSSSVSPRLRLKPSDADTVSYGTIRRTAYDPDAVRVLRQSSTRSSSVTAVLRSSDSSRPTTSRSLKTPCGGGLANSYDGRESDSEGGSAEADVGVGVGVGAGSCSCSCPCPRFCGPRGVAGKEESVRSSWVDRWASRCESCSNRLSRGIGVAVVLENSGSVARDHLASERTFLAYVRTSLSLASSGIALVQLFSMSAELPNIPERIRSPLVRSATPLGAITVCFGLLVLCIGVMRFFHVQQALTEGIFPPARGSILLISALLALIVTVVFGLLVTITRAG